MKKVDKLLLATIIVIVFGGVFFQFKIKLDKQLEIPIPTLAPTPTVTFTLTPTILIPTRIISPKPTVIISIPLTLDELFVKYGSQYNVSPDVLRKIAGCESGYDVNQVTGDYAGLFQFALFAWVEARGRMGLSNDQSLRFNAEESIRTAAFEINYKGTSGWDDCD